MHILENNPLSGMSCANMFSRCVAYLLILLMPYFVEQTFLILVKSSLSIISLPDYAFGAVSKKEPPSQGH